MELNKEDFFATIEYHATNRVLTLWWFVLCCFYAGLLLDLLYVVHVLFFPTCQVRVVRFYQSCSSSPPP